VLNLYLILMII